MLRVLPCAISMELHATASLALAEALRPARVAEDSHDELGSSGIGVAQDVLIHYGVRADIRTPKTFLKSMRDIMAETSFVGNFVGNSFDRHYVEAGTSRATKQNTAKGGLIPCGSWSNTFPDRLVCTSKHRHQHERSRLGRAINGTEIHENPWPFSSLCDSRANADVGMESHI
ncbi:hypothetical protein IEO21_04888 [Rhodonia placenta]|uniref:Uncharacterized protein n=1 Tax=Rhodonia placenta TaxID=104341 RepID=A0A8H7P367_9APHY|nr:hypothetical protein IEO21_04888 [Postia placenta]